MAEATYTRSDALQAVTAALLFAFDAGLAAQDERESREASPKRPLYPGGGAIVMVSDSALDLLADAQTVASKMQDEWFEDRGIVYHSEYATTHWHVDRAVNAAFGG